MNKNKVKHRKQIVSFFGDSLTEGLPGVSFFKILKRRLPEFKLLNYGKGGDTVISLYRRIKRINFNKFFDIAFLWVGTNDVYVKLSRTYPLIKILLKQQWAKNIDEFKRYYRFILKILCNQANRVVTVSPLLLGENIDNVWNRELEALSVVIEKLSATPSNIEYINLRKFIIPKLTLVNSSDYVPKRAMIALRDALLLKRKKQIDKKASNRGLYFTFDGCHLNSMGAEMVSDIFLKTIKNN